MKPLISVITVCKNSEKFIESCIQSVINQNYNNFEYIIIDGGSKDCTVEIIKKYSKYINYWHSEKDNGLAEAFNIGFKKSLGRWILYLNSDDMLSNRNCLKDMSNYLAEYYESDVVMGEVEVVTRELMPRFIRGPYGKDFQWRSFIIKDTIPHQSAFINRNYFNKVGLFNEKLKIAVDYEHFLRGGKDISVVFKPIRIALMRDGGLSQNNLITTIKDWHNARVASGNVNTIYSLILMLYQLFKLRILNLFRK